eukprot:191486_1
MSLNVKNCYNYIVSKTFENEAKEIEKWYGTKYKTEIFDNDLINKCQCIHVNNVSKQLHTPLPNPYIAKHFEIFEQKNDDEKNEINIGPKVIYSNEKCKIYFQKDNVFKRPKLCVSIAIQ